MTLMATGCGGPQSALDPAGPSAWMISWLWWGMFSFFTLVFFVLVGLWILAMRRQKEPASQEQARRIHNRWIIGGGILLPLISVTAILAFGIPAGQRLQLLDPDDTPLIVEAIAHQWWWEFRYPELGITTANHLYLPVGQTVEIRGSSQDVIHSFWVPRLGGKIDLVPGRVNTLRLRASATGSMRGQCAEFCGTGHAHMIFAVDVLQGVAFRRWQSARQQPVTVPPEHQAAATAFQDNCGQCHTVNGVSTGSGAPDLTDVGARRLIGAGLKRGRSLSVREWLTDHPRAGEIGLALEDHRQAPDQLNLIAAWLETLGND